MTTVVLGPPPPALAAFLEQRRALGQDLHDEVWEGSYHVAPAAGSAHGVVDDELAVLLRPYARAAGLVGTGPVNLGELGDYRVPDRAYHRGRPTGTYLPTAAVVVEVLSPNDETFAKFGFYARHRVDELLIADPAARTVQCWRRAGDGYVETGAGALLGVTAATLTDRVDWP
jgi:Uma2 family endonuclease